jgi:hypothetical protein
MEKYTEQELKEIFANRFDCYADTEDDSVVMAMSEERYLDVLRELKILPIQHVSNPLSCDGCKYHNTLNDDLCGDCGDTYKNKAT